MPQIASKVQVVPVGDLVEEGMREYSIYNLEERHFPDFRDGLKPVHRRILYTMFEDNNLWNSRFTKCAAVAGNTTARYHPHGGDAVYLAMVGIAGEPLKKNKKVFFGPNSNYPLIEGYGNFGSIDGDSCAAMRYTEARLSVLAQFMFKLSTVTKYTDNYLNNRKEPIYLPSTLPFLLLNGVSGIGVGLTTDIPSHNLAEVCDGLIYILKSKKPTFEKLASYIKGPDWQYGGILWDKKQVTEAYRNGTGTINWGLETSIEKVGKRYVVEITGIPPIFNLKNYLESLQSGTAFKKISNKSKGVDFTKSVKRIAKLEISDNIKIRVELSDSRAAEEIVGYRYTTKNNWNVTAREVDNTKFKTLNLLSFMTEWVDWSIKVHKEYFLSEINRLIKEIRLDFIRIKVTQNHNKIIKLIKEEKFEAIRKFLKCNDEELEFVKRISLGSFAKSNVSRILKRIDDKKQEIDGLKYNFKFTKKYLINFFTEMKTYSRERKTLYIE